MKKNYSNTTNPFLILLILLFVLGLSGCAKIDELTGIQNDENNDLMLRKYSGAPLAIPPLVQFILDKKNIESLNLNGNIRKVCDYSKIPITTVFLEDWNKAHKIDPNVRVLSLLDSRKLDNESITVITDFVAKGGTLFLPFGCEDARLSFLIGMKPIPENNFQTDMNATGVYFSTPIIPGLKGKVYNKQLTFFGLKQELFSDKIKILATAANNNKYPLIIENSVGEGRVIYYNSNFYFTKSDRGLLMSGILKGLEGIPYPVVNIGTIFLDDFPSPLYDVKKEPIASELNLTITDYVYKVWWPDLVQLAKKHKISYSAMTTFDYNKNIKPPFLFKEWDSHKIKINGEEEGLSNWLVKDILKNNHELAFHGYNHVSLMAPFWKNPDFMFTSLKAAEKKWTVSDFGEMPVTYVPPSNDIDRTGLKELNKAMPSLKFMCSIYLGEKKLGGDREFDFDPYESKLFDFPRVSFGFYVDEDLSFAIHSLYMYTGIWTHFLHPDDVYQIKDKSNISQGDYDLRNRENLGWYKTPHSNKAMLPEFDNLITTLKTDFPYMRFTNAREGVIATNDWRASYFNHKPENEFYTVEKLNPNESKFESQDWFVYGSAENSKKIETHLIKLKVAFKKTPCMDGYLFSVRSKTAKLTMPNFNFKTETEIKKLPLIVKKVESDYQDYLIALENSTKFFEENGDSDEQQKAEIKLLKNRMLSEAKIDPIVWNKYAEYMSWEDKTDEVWKLLEEHCIKYPYPENILYSKELSKIAYYPNDLSYEKWLSAQMLVTPNDKDLLNSYIANFNTPENQEKIKNALTNLLKIDTSKNSFIRYIDYLVNYEPQNALAELDKIVPSEEYRDLATVITWLYADNNQYKKAYDWSTFSTEVDFYNKMQWLAEIKEYSLLQKEYNNYIATHPNDFRAIAQMSTVYHDMGKFKESWILANTLPEESADKESLQKMLNADIVYEEKEVQDELINNYSGLFYPEVLKKMMETNRLEYGNFINYNTELQTNRQNLSAYKNVLSYNRYDKKKNLHGFGVTYNSMYRIENDLPDYEDNRTHNIFGIQYQFNNPKSFEKIQYWSKFRYEYSHFNKSFFQFGAGVNFSKNKSYSSAEFRIAPFENGPSHSKSIYRFQLNLYQDYFFLKYFNTSLSIEVNYYNRSEMLNEAYFVKESYEGSITGKVIYDRWMEKKYRFLPFVEATRTQASLGQSTVPLSTGYPYWMIDDRFFIGGGLGFAIGKPEDDFSMKVEGAWFNDD